MSAANDRAVHGESKVGAGVAAVGGGTSLVALANLLPDGHELKPFLVWGAPTVTAVAGGLWLWAQAKISNYWRDRQVNAIAHHSRGCDQGFRRGKGPRYPHWDRGLVGGKSCVLGVVPRMIPGVWAADGVDSSGSEGWWDDQGHEIEKGYGLPNDEG